MPGEPKLEDLSRIPDPFEGGASPGATPSEIRVGRRAPSVTHAR